jgi:hypothetical protein
VVKLEYQPSTFSSLVAVSSSPPFSANDIFKMGTANFALDALVRPTNAQPYLILLQKISADWGADAGTGYVFFIDTANQQAAMTINNGGTTLTVVSGSGTVPNEQDSWVRAAVNRAGNMDIYVNGVLKGSLDIHTRTASIDATLLAYTGQGSGNIGMLRIDKGRLLGVGWAALEYKRLKYGYPRDLRDFSALWLFPGDLYDTTLAYPFTSGGTPTYGTGYPTGLISYHLPWGFDWGHDIGFIDADDTQRALDGSAFLYRGPRKRRTSLSFECDDEQRIVLESAYASGNPVNFYEDDTLPRSFQGYITRAPQVRSIMSGYWSMELEMEES